MSLAVRSPANNPPLASGVAVCGRLAHEWERDTVGLALSLLALHVLKGVRPGIHDIVEREPRLDFAV